nr:MAG TPA: Protein of unknown function (DUF3417) [Caudoviricetes sp.]
MGSQYILYPFSSYFSMEFELNFPLTTSPSYCIIGT